MKKIIFLLLMGISSALTADEAKISHSISSKVKPWTSKPLLDSSDKFHFAIFSDNTGESREGVFAEAVEKVNLLQRLSQVDLMKLFLLVKILYEVRSFRFLELMIL